MEGLSGLLLCSSNLPGGTSALGELLLLKQTQAVLRLPLGQRGQLWLGPGQAQEQEGHQHLCLFSSSVALSIWVSVAQHQMAVFTPKLSILPDISIQQVLTQRQ